MTRAYTPRPYQGMITDHILDVPRCGIWAGMGLGKTVGTATAIAVLVLLDDDPILVIAPKRVARSTWPDEMEKWEHTKDIVIQPIIGSASARLMAVQRKAHVYTINYESLPWLIVYWGDRWPYKTVVADESTKLKGFRLRQGGKRAGMLAKLAHTKIKRFVELTGTPAPNGLIDLWGQMWFLDQGKRLGRTFQAFKDRWFRVGHNGFGYEPLPFAQQQIQEALADICISIEAKDWFDLKDPIVSNIYVDLPARARKAYEELEKQMFTQFSNGDTVEAFNAASLTMKCLQMCNGASYVNGGNTEWQETHDEKILALEEIIEEAAGMPVLVAYHFKSDLARLKKAFPAGRELDANPKTIADWNAGKIPVLFAHPQSAGHGLNLQDGGNILVYFAHWWNLEERQQILERVGPTRQMQAGHDRPVFVYNIIARNTVDDDVIARTESKRAVQDILMDSMKRRQGGKVVAYADLL